MRRPDAFRTMSGLLPQLVLRVLAAGLVPVLLGSAWVLWATTDAAREDARDDEAGINLAVRRQETRVAAGTAIQQFCGVPRESA